MGRTCKLCSQSRCRIRTSPSRPRGVRHRWEDIEAASFKWRLYFTAMGVFSWNVRTYPLFSLDFLRIFLGSGASNIWEGQWSWVCSHFVHFRCERSSEPLGVSKPHELHPSLPQILPCPFRCDLGDPKRGGGRPPGCHAATVLLRDRVQHGASSRRGGRLQPLRLAAEERLWFSRRAAEGPCRAHPAGPKHTVPWPCEHHAKWSAEQLIRSDLWPGK